MTITKEILFKAFPKCNKDLVNQLIPFMNEYLPAFGIETKLEMCHFLAQAGVETDSFKTLVEYASGKAYEFRYDLGNTMTGDGVKFKGHGIFNTTGKTNHAIAGKKIFGNPLFGKDRLVFANDAVIENPKLLAQPQWAVASACIYWVEKDLSNLCRPDNEKVTIKRLIKNRWQNYECYPIEAISRKVNGGMNGFEERKANYEKLKLIIPDDAPAVAA